MDRTTVICVAAVVLIVMNIASYALMGYDKQCARKRKRRVPERRLFLVTACFGGLGGVLGMTMFHHKTRHWYFKVFFPMLLVIQIALLVIGAYLLFRA